MSRNFVKLTALTAQLRTLLTTLLMFLIVSRSDLNKNKIDMDTSKLKVQKLLYGQLIIGPPGSGKSTYCHKITEFYKQLNRKVSIVNLDPANENMQYAADIDIMNLITVENVMENFSLGPNGALMYCMEFLETNFDWLLIKIKESPSNYFLFDCPGELEASTT